MPIEWENLSPKLKTIIGGEGTAAAEVGIAGDYSNPGARAINILKLAADVAEGECLSIGFHDGSTPRPGSCDVFEVETVATPTGQVTAGGELAVSPANPIVISKTLAQLGVEVGDLLCIENEILKVQSDLGAAGVLLLRARSATVLALHADGLSIDRGSGITAGRIPVGFKSAKTPSLASVAFAAEINNAAANGERASSKASTVYASMQATVITAAETVIETVEVGEHGGLPSGFQFHSTLAGVGNGWSGATAHGGSEPGAKQVVRLSREPTAAEITSGNMFFSLPFTPRSVDVSVRTTATGVQVAWTGAVLITGGRVKVNNAGAVDWTVAETIHVTAYE